MKCLQLLLIIVIIPIISACTAGNTRENDFVSVIDNDRMMNKVATIIVEQYLKANGCEKRFSKQIIGPISNDSERPNKYKSEHWVVNACDVTHNLKIDFYEGGSKVEANTYKP